MGSDDWTFVRSRVQFFPKGCRKPVKINPKAQKVGLAFRCGGPGQSKTVAFRLVGLVRPDCSFTNFQVKKVDCSRFRDGVVSLSFGGGDILFLNDCVPINVREFIHSLGSVGVHGAFRRPPAMPTQKYQTSKIPERNMFEGLDDDSLKNVVSFCSQTNHFKMVCSRFAQILADQRSVLNIARLTASKVLLPSEDIIRLILRHRRLSTLNFGCYPHVSLAHMRQISDEGCFKNLKVLNLDNVRKLSDGVTSSLLIQCEQLEILSFVDCPKLSAACLSKGISPSIISIACGSSNGQSSNSIDQGLFDQMLAHNVCPVVMELKNCASISNLHRLPACVERVRHFQLSNAQLVPPDQFELLKLLPKTLRLLDLSHSPIANIRCLLHFDSLHYVSLAGCPISAQGFCDVLPQCESLRVVDLSSCRSIDRFVLADVFAIPSLLALAVNDCTRLSEDAFSGVGQCASGVRAIAVGGTGLEFPMFAWLANHLHQRGASPDIKVVHSVVWREFIGTSFD